MSKPKNDRPMRETDAPPTHQEMVARLKADPQCDYQELEDDEEGEGVIIMGVDPEWAAKHMKASRRKR
jgi:hypothetical protein